MAENLSQKTPKTSEKSKLANAINRTTSETMRLGEPEKNVNHPTSLASTTPSQRKKAPAFQITSVTVGPRISSNDGGDDSADDLDESHTDDFSDVLDTSRITDIENETPSFSEDTFSKEDVFFNATAASLGTAPVIPTSSQYGLAIVATESEVNNPSASVISSSGNGAGDASVSVTESGNIVNLSGGKQNEGEMRDMHSNTGRNERFKVVKIESTEPFKRGRWMCMDYLDHTMQQQSQQPIIVRPAETTETGSVQYAGADSGVVITDGIHQGVDDQYAVDQQQNMANITSAQSMPVHYTNISPGQTLNQHQSLQPQQIVQQGLITDPSQPVVIQHQSMSQVPMQQTIPNQPQVMHHQSLPPQQIQQAMTAVNMPQQVGSLPQQGFVPQQYDQLPQQYYAATSMGIPVSGIQLLPQTSIAAVHTPANPQPSSTSVFTLPTMVVTSQPNLQQPITSVPIHVTTQPLPVGVNTANTTAGAPLPVSITQTLPLHQIPVVTAAQIITPQQLTPQQQQQIHQQLLAQQQMQQKLPSQPQMLPPQQMGIPSSQSMTVQQQPVGIPSSQPMTIQQQPVGIPSSQPMTTQQQPVGIPSSQPMTTQQPMGIPSSQPVTSQQQPVGIPSSQPLTTQQQPVGIPSQPMPAVQQHQMAGSQPQMSNQGMSQQMVGMAMQQQTGNQISQQAVPSQQQPMTGQSQIINQPPQQAMGGQIPQQPVVVQSQVASQPSQAMAGQIPQQQTVTGQSQAGNQIPNQALTGQISQQQQVIGQAQVPQQSMGGQFIPQQSAGGQQQVASQSQQQAMAGQFLQQTMGGQQQGAGAQIPQQNQGTSAQVSQPGIASQVPQQSHIQQTSQQQQTQLPLAQQIPVASQPPQIITPTSQGILPPQQQIPTTVGAANIQQPTQPVPHVHRQLPLLPNQQPFVPGESAVASTIPASSAVFSSSVVTSAQNQPIVVTPMATSSVAPVTGGGVLGAGSVAGTTGGVVNNASDPNVLAGTVSNPVKEETPSNNAALVDSLQEAVGSTTEENQTSAAGNAGEDAESASGTSAVAIDNKIEQAMDLVKSHLMFAVREEVEVLKEKIAELMDRINQLELENTILKAHASQETLAQLTGNNPQPQGNKNQQTQPPTNGSVS